MIDGDAGEGEHEAPARRRPGRGWWRATLLAVALAHPLAGLVARRDWRADLLTHFQEPALGATLVAALAFARRHRRLALGLAALAAAQCWPLVCYDAHGPIPADPGAPARVRILMANVLADNRDHDALVRLVRREAPDVVGLVEYADHWRAALGDELRAEYPHRAEVPAGNLGLALWFRERPEEVDWGAPVPGGWPWMHARLRIGGRPAHLWLVHPSNPLSRRGRLPGHPELADLASLAGRAEGPRIVIGDLNCTDGSPHFGDFLRTSGLRDSRLGFGRQPSWPTWSPYRIAIDHAFVSPDLAVVGRRLGPEIGSDHRPVILDVAPAPGASRNPATQAAQSVSGSTPANLTRSASRRNATRGPARSSPTRAGKAGSAAISSVVRDAQDGPNRAASASRTDADQAIIR